MSKFRQRLIFGSLNVGNHPILDILNSRLCNFVFIILKYESFHILIKYVYLLSSISSILFLENLKTFMNESRYGRPFHILATHDWVEEDEGVLKDPYFVLVGFFRLVFCFSTLITRGVSFLPCFLIFQRNGALQCISTFHYFQENVLLDQIRLKRKATCRKYAWKRNCKKLMKRENYGLLPLKRNNKTKWHSAI